VLASELAARPRNLFAGIVVPHQLVSSVTAHVVERADLVVGVLHDDDRCAHPDRRHLPGEVVALAGEPFDQPDVEPELLEDRLLFELVALGVDRVLVVHRRGAELRPVLCPATGGRFRKMCHFYPSWSGSTPKVLIAMASAP